MSRNNPLIEENGYSHKGVADPKGNVRQMTARLKT